MNSLPMYFPQNFDMDIAKLCAQLSAYAYAYDQYSQWVNQVKPQKESGFTWAEPAETGLTFSSPFWSSEKWLGLFNQSEPSDFVARADNHNLVNSCEYALNNPGDPEDAARAAGLSDCGRAANRPSVWPFKNTA